MRLVFKFIFFGFLTAIFLTEGLGFNNGREIAYLLVLALPGLLFTIDFFSGKKFFLSRRLLFLFSGFLILSAVSTFYAVNIQRSFEQILYLLAVFLTFIYVSNHRRDLERPLMVFIFAVSGFFLVYYLLINFVLPGPLAFLIPHRGYQYVFPYYKTHNPLAPLLLILVIVGLFQILEKKYRFLIPFLIFFPVLLFSYSGSAYQAFAVTIFIIAAYLIKTRRLKILSPVSLVFAVLAIAVTVLFLSSVSNLKQPPPLFKAVNRFVTGNLKLVPKPLFSGRDIYYGQAWQSVKNKPWFGVGPGNFIYISLNNFSKDNLTVETAHNIFLDYFSEHGLPAGIIFGLILLEIIWSGRKLKTVTEKSLLFAFISVILVFQTDFIQRYYSYFLLFFIIAGLIYDDDRKDKIAGRTVAFFSGLLLLISLFMAVSGLLYVTGHYRLAFYSYPLGQEKYERMITYEKSQGNYKNVTDLLILYGRIYPGDFNVLNYIGGAFYDYNRTNLSEKYFQTAESLLHQPKK